MNFNSLQYLLFLPIVTLLYYLLPKQLKNPMLLCASYLFYMCWEPKYALLMLLSTVISWGCGLCIAAKPTQKKLWLASSLCINLGILFLFKYFNFFSQTFFSLLGQDGISLQLLLPVGISCDTLQAIGYTIGVDRGTLPAEKNFLQFALFISFFPQLVAGPIERAEHILPQLRKVHPFRYENLQAGLLPILWGLFKKMVIADNLAVLVNTAYQDIAAANGLQLAFATLCFAFQILCDFSAYTDIARGSARLLGIRLMENFRAPYLADSIKDFWRRWHISLSGWFRDYLYIPLGGSRRGSFRHCLNLFLVFLISGLWHGAAISFVCWGALHGLYQICGILLKPLRERLYQIIPKNSRILRIFKTAVTFTLVVLTWVFFRANNLSDAFAVLSKIFTVPGTVQSILSLGLPLPTLCVTALSVLLLAYVDAKGADTLCDRLTQTCLVRYGLYFLLILAILVFGYYGAGYNPQDFIYFQF